MTPIWAGFAPLVLATDAEAPQRRAEVAREVFGRQILRVEVEPLGDDFRTDLMPGLKMITGWANGVTTERASALLSDGNDDIVISIGGVEGKLF